MKCSSCHFESENVGLFRHKQKMLGGEIHHYCPVCQIKENDSQHRLAYMPMFCWLLLGSIIIYLDQDTVLGWIMINLGLFRLWLMASSLCHEFAHFVAGKLLGASISHIVIGEGKALLTFSIGRTRFAICPNANSGINHIQYCPDSMLNWRYFLLVLSGPLSHLLIIVVLELVTGYGLASYEYPMQEAAWLLMGLFVNLYLLFANLWPRKIQPIDGMDTRNDGAQLLSLILRPKYAKERIQALNSCALLEEKMLTASGIRMQQKIDSNASYFPDYIQSGLLKIQCQLLAGEFSKAKRTYQTLKQNSRWQKHQGFIDYGYTMVGFLEKPITRLESDKLQHCELLAGRLMLDMPGFTEARIGLAAITAESDKIQQAYDILQTVDSHVLNDRIAADYFAVLAYIYFRQDSVQLAYNAIKQAQTLAKYSVFVQRYSNTIVSLPVDTH